MKLDNKGWGLTQMLVCCGILVLFLVISIVMINRLMNPKAKNLSKNIAYSLKNSDIENNVEKASLRYFNDYYKQNINWENITITIENLKYRNYLTENDLKTENTKCGGYALIMKNEQEKITAKAYIDCKNYVTTGYQIWRLGA